MGDHNYLLQYIFLLILIYLGILFFVLMIMRGRSLKSPTYSFRGILKNYLPAFISSAVILFLSLLLMFGLFSTELDKQNEHGRQSAAGIADMLTEHIRHYQSLSRFMATQSGFIEVLEEGTFASEDLSIELDSLNETFETSVCYLMNRQAEVVMTTNRKDEGSFLGNNYSFRPYFQQALGGYPYVFMALGVDSLKRGIYFSTPVYSESRIVGVAVVKVNMERLQKILNPFYGLLIVSRDNRILYTQKESWVYRPFVLDQIGAFPGRNPTEIEVFGEVSTPLIEGNLSDRNLYWIDDRFFHLSIHPLGEIEWLLVVFSEIEALRNQLILAVVFASLLILLPFISNLIFQIVQERNSLREIILSEPEFRLLFENAPEIICVVNHLTGLILAVNQEAVSFLGEDKEYLLKLSFFRFFDSPLEEIQEDSKKVQVRIKTLRREIRICSLSYSRVRFRGEVCDLFFVQDITELEKSKDALVKSEYRFRSLLDTIPETIFEIDDTYCIQYVNNQGLMEFGMDESRISEGSLQEWMHLADSEIERILQQSANQTEETRWTEHDFYRSDGSRFPGALFAIPVYVSEKVHYRGLIIDLTQRKRLEEIERNQSKMETIGGLAGGLAHGFNNVLSSLRGAITLLLEEEISEEEHLELRDSIDESFVRGSDMADQLLIFASGGTPVSEEFALQSLLEPLIQEFADRMAIVFEGEESCGIKGDVGLIRQVFLQLFSNAVEKDPPAEQVVVRAAQVVSHNNRQIRILCTDSGASVTPEIQSRLYDPFFSTKPGHSGLGLSIVYSIIRKHRGDIRYSSEEGRSEFEFFLPAAEPVDSKVKGSGEKKGHVLLMDDNPIILKVSSKMLSRLGMSIQTAKKGEEAVNLFRVEKAMGHPFDLVILDLQISEGTGGVETANLLFQIDPDVKIIASSGYSEDFEMADYHHKHFSAILPKPYDLDDLRKVIDSIKF